MRWWSRMPAGVAVWQPYGAVGRNGLDGVWVACGTLARMDAGGVWEVEGGVWLRSNLEGLLAWCERDDVMRQ